MTIIRTGMRQYQDPLIRHAEDVIYSTYGDVVRVQDKKKDLLKFGSVASTQGTSEQTIMELQGTEIRETYATGNSVNSLICTDTNFTGNVYIEGHTISGGNLTFATQTVAATGQTRKALTTSLCRVTRANIPGATGFTTPASDKLYIYDNAVATTPVSGVPDDATATKLVINGVEYQSEKCATSLSSQDYWIVTSLIAGIEKKTGASATIRVRTRTLTNVFRTVAPKLHLDADGASFDEVTFYPHLIIPKNSDIELTVEGSASGIQCSAGLLGYMALVQ